MLAYRIVHKNFTLLIASGMAGRWNSNGRKVIYCASSIALSFLESMVRRQGVGFNDDFRILLIEIPDKLKISIINVETLNKGWRDFRNYSSCQVVGDQWFDNGETAVLQVPSAVLPEENNFVLNTTHPDFKKIKVIETTELFPDERIDEILKKYR